MPTYEIECGEHKGRVVARGPGAAWRKLTKNKTEGFCPLARYRELPLNGRSYKLGRGIWFYVQPSSLDTMR